MSFLTNPTTLAVLAIVLLAAVAIAVLIRNKTVATADARPVMTSNQQAMFFRLIEALPDYFILPQVSLAALLASKTPAQKTRFDAKAADFVICTKTLDVVAIVEFDDSGKSSQERRDGDNVNLLRNAGYEVYQYKKIPGVSVIRHDLIPVANDRLTIFRSA